MEISDAIFSEDRIYRYVLIREWDIIKPALMIIGLNPSTADETKNDPTIRRCIGFAKKWGYGKLYMTNLFAFRATLPKDLFAFSKPIGLKNDFWIKKISREVDKVILAYGNLGKYMKRNRDILNIIEKPYCVKISKTGFPMHPLYLKYTDEPVVFEKENF